MEIEFEFKSTTYRDYSINGQDLFEAGLIEEDQINDRDLLEDYAVQEMHEDPDVSSSWAENAEVTPTIAEQETAEMDKMECIAGDIFDFTNDTLPEGIDEEGAHRLARIIMKRFK